MPCFAQVILDRSTGKTLDYEIPAGWEGRVAAGSRVRVPLRNRQVIGTVVAVTETTSAKGVRPLAAVMDERPQMTPVLMKLAKWMAEYYGCDEQDALRCVLPRAVRETGHAPLKRKFASLAKPVSAEEIAALRTKAPRQAAVLEHLQANGPVAVARLTAETGASDAAVKTLARRGLVQVTAEEVRRAPLGSEEFVASKPPVLSAEQEHALEGIRPALRDPAAHKPIVLKGITGSGKTEVYLRAIDEVLRAGKTALVLVPEIALTPQTVERFSSRFTPQGIEVAVLHSHLSEGERHDEWHRVRSGQARIVIGARGAVFAPLENPGLIVIDEEHDNSYKQDEGPRYHARDLAVVRGKMEPCAVLLGSATPSLETFENCRKGKYDLLELSHRHDGCVLPVFVWSTCVCGARTGNVTTSLFRQSWGWPLSRAWPRASRRFFFSTAADFSPCWPASPAGKMWSVRTAVFRSPCTKRRTWPAATSAVTRKSRRGDVRSATIRKSLSAGWARKKSRRW